MTTFALTDDGGIVGLIALLAAWSGMACWLARSAGHQVVWRSVPVVAVTVAILLVLWLYLFDSAVVGPMRLRVWLATLASGFVFFGVTAAAVSFGVVAGARLGRGWTVPWICGLLAGALAFWPAMFLQLSASFLITGVSL